MNHEKKSRMARVEEFHEALDRSLEVVESYMAMVNEVQINGHQSRRLERLYSDIGEYLERSMCKGIEGSQLMKLNHNLEHLNINLEKGHALASKWFKLLLTGALSELAFQEVYESLQRSMNTLVPDNLIFQCKHVDFRSDFVLDCNELQTKSIKVSLSLIGRCQKAVNIVKHEVKNVEINVDQCKRLADIFGEVGGQCQTLQHHHKIIHSSELKLWLDNMEELLMKLEEGQALVLECASADWFELLLAGGLNNGAAFLEIFDALQRSMKGLILGFKFSWSRDDFLIDFSKDQQDLQAKIVSVLHSSINSSLNIVNNVKNVVGDAQIYVHQCRRLAFLSGEIGEQLEVIQGYEIEESQSTMLRRNREELFINLKKVLALVSECASTDCFDRLLVRGDNEKEFLEVYEFLQKSMNKLNPDFQFYWNEDDFKAELKKDHDDLPKTIASLLHILVDNCLNAVIDLQNIAEHVQINGHQCRRLSDVYIQIGTQLESFRGQGIDLKAHYYSTRRNNLEELLINLQRGRALVSELVHGDWSELVLLKGGNEAAFLEVFDALHKTIKNMFPHFNFCHVNPENFKADAIKDHDELRRKLNEEHTRMFQCGLTTSSDNQSFYSLCKLATERLESEGSSESTLLKLPSCLELDGSMIKIGRPLGKGAYGEVYEAEFLGSKFAVKVFISSNIVDLRREVEILCNLRHTHIVQLVGFASTKNSNMILMELTHGDLRRFIDLRASDQKGLKNSKHQSYPPFTDQIALDIISQIASGMAYLHNRGVLNGDLKASNILYKKYDNFIEVKVADFGVSQQVIFGDIYSSNIGGSGAYSGVRGSRGWRAPEVFKEHIMRYGCELAVVQPTYTAKADVYSFTITWEILTGLSLRGRMPFEDVKGSVYEWVMAGYRPPLPENLNSRLQKLIDECWATDPEKRPTFSSICEVLDEVKSGRLQSVDKRQGKLYPRPTPRKPKGKVFRCLQRALTMCGTPNGTKTSSQNLDIL